MLSVDVLSNVSANTGDANFSKRHRKVKSNGILSQEKESYP
jgi:hypothetical protein